MRNVFQKITVVTVAFIGSSLANAKELTPAIAKHHLVEGAFDLSQIDQMAIQTHNFLIIDKSEENIPVIESLTKFIEAIDREKEWTIKKQKHSPWLGYVAGGVSAVAIAIPSVFISILSADYIKKSFAKTESHSTSNATMLSGILLGTIPIAATTLGVTNAVNKAIDKNNKNRGLISPHRPSLKSLSHHILYLTYDELTHVVGFLKAQQFQDPLMLTSALAQFAENIAAEKQLLAPKSKKKVVLGSTAGIIGLIGTVLVGALIANKVKKSSREKNLTGSSRDSKSSSNPHNASQVESESF